MKIVGDFNIMFYELFFTIVMKYKLCLLATNANVSDVMGTM